MPATTTLNTQDINTGQPNTQIRVSKNGDGLVAEVVDANGNVLKGIPVSTGESLAIPLPPVVTGDDIWAREANETAIAVSRASRDLLTSVSLDAKTTAGRLKSSYNSFLIMLWLTFAIGFFGFIAALWRGFTAGGSTEAVVVTGIFGGLTASSFIATFIARPTGAMGAAGPRAAWVQAIVTTYWSKLAYMNKPESVLTDLQDAQSDLAEAMQLYIRVTAEQERRATRRRTSTASSASSSRTGTRQADDTGASSTTADPTSSKNKDMGSFPHNGAPTAPPQGENTTTPEARMKSSTTDTGSSAQSGAPAAPRQGPHAEDENVGADVLDAHDNHDVKSEPAPEPAPEPVG